MKKLVEDQDEIGFGVTESIREAPKDAAFEKLSGCTVIRSSSNARKNLVATSGAFTMTPDISLADSDENENVAEEREQDAHRGKTDEGRE